MERKTYDSVRRLLLVGLMAAVVTVLGGELPIGWTVYPESDNYILSMILGSADLSLWQLACGVFFGGAGIAVQAFGFEGVARMVEACGNRRAGRVIHWGALATGSLGGMMHILCVALMFLCRALNTQTMTALPQMVIDFTLWLVMPITVVFMPVYYAMTIAMLLVIARGRTMLPKWAAVFNPLLGMVLLNAVRLIAPASELVNALGMANMGIGSTLTFAGLLILMGRRSA